MTTDNNQEPPGIPVWDGFPEAQPGEQPEERVEPDAQPIDLLLQGDDDEERQAHRGAIEPADHRRGPGAPGPVAPEVAACSDRYAERPQQVVYASAAVEAWGAEKVEAGVGVVVPRVVDLDRLAATGRQGNSTVAAGS